jgi:starch synthase
MTQVEAGASGKPVLGIAAMALLDTFVHGETAFLARVAEENRITETLLGPDPNTGKTQHIVFDPPRIADYRADVGDLHQYLTILMTDPDIRQTMGKAARERVVRCFDYRVVAQRFVEIVSRRLGIS